MAQQIGKWYVREFTRFRQGAQPGHGGMPVAKRLFLRPLLSLDCYLERKAEARLSKAFSSRKPEDWGMVLSDGVISAHCCLFGARRLLRLYSVKHVLEGAINAPGRVEGRSYRYSCLLSSMGLGPEPVPASQHLPLSEEISWIFLG